MIFSKWVAGTMSSRVRKRKLFCETNSTPQEPYCTRRNERKNSTWAKITNCEFQMFYEKFASEKRIPGKWRRQECDYSSNSMNNRIMIAMDRLACSWSASSRYRKFFSWRIKRSMWTLYQAFADRSTSQVYLWAITPKRINKLQFAYKKPPLA